MNLRELLIQFSGINDDSLKLDELLSDRVKGIKVEETMEGSVKLLLNNPKDLEEVKERIENILEQNGYFEYSIEPLKEGLIYHILVKANK
jgi:hypothetical protein